MKKNVFTVLLSLMLCLLVILPASAQTREGVIMLEGMEEPIEETLFESPQGFSFWYANEALEAYNGEEGNMEGAIVAALWSDDFMILSVIPEEDALDYADDFDESIVDMAAAGRVQADVYRDLEDGRYYFLTLIAENGQYLRAVGEYSQEAAEGNAKYFDRVLDSVEFGTGCPILAEWGEEDDEGEDAAQVILTALEPVTDAALLQLDWDDFTAAWAPAVFIGSLDAGQSVTVTLEFIGDMPDNGIIFTDEEGVTHAYALDISGEDGSLYFWDLEEE